MADKFSKTIDDIEKIVIEYVPDAVMRSQLMVKIIPIIGDIVLQEIRELRQSLDVVISDATVENEEGVFQSTEDREHKG